MSSWKDSRANTMDSSESHGVTLKNLSMENDKQPSGTVSNDVDLTGNRTRETQSPSQSDVPATTPATPAAIPDTYIPLNLTAIPTTIDSSQQQGSSSRIHTHIHTQQECTTPHGGEGHTGRLPDGGLASQVQPPSLRQTQAQTQAQAQAQTQVQTQGWLPAGMFVPQQPFLQQQAQQQMQPHQSGGTNNPSQAIPPILSTQRNMGMPINGEGVQPQLQTHLLSQLMASGIFANMTQQMPSNQTNLPNITTASPPGVTSGIGTHAFAPTVFMAPSGRGNLPPMLEINRQHNPDLSINPNLQHALEATETSNTHRAGTGIEEWNASLAAKGKKDPPFPLKLHQILNNPEFSECISWNPNGRSWRILKPNVFEQLVIPLYFRHAKYASFMRQVNGWGFQRIISGNDHNSYYHPLFVKSSPDLSLQMKRRKKTDRRSDESVEDRHPHKITALPASTSKTENASSNHGYGYLTAQSIAQLQQQLQQQAQQQQPLFSMSPMPLSQPQAPSLNNPTNALMDGLFAMPQQPMMTQQPQAYAPQPSFLSYPSATRPLAPTMDSASALKKLQEALVAAQAASTPVPNSLSFGASSNNFYSADPPQAFDNTEFEEQFGDDDYDDDDDEDVDFNDDNSAIV